VIGLLGSLVLAAHLQPSSMAPAARYGAHYLGRYAKNGACSDPEAIWQLSAKEVVRGRLTCDVNSVSDADGALRLRLRGCSRDGEAVRARSYVIDLMSADVLMAAGPFGREMIRRCP